MLSLLECWANKTLSSTAYRVAENRRNAEQTVPTTIVRRVLEVYGFAQPDQRKVYNM